MTISSETRKAGPFTGNGVTTAFPFAFKVFAKADVSVILTVVSTGAQSTLVLDSDYTLVLNADQDANPGGTVTYNPSGVAMPSTKTLTIGSVVGNTQGYKPTNGGAWLPANAGDAWDRAVILIQQLLEKLNRSIKFPIVDGTLTSELPTAALRANKGLRFDASGNVGVTASDPDTAVVAAAASASAAAISQGAAATSASAASASATAASGSSTSAAASAATAQAAAQAQLWRDVVFKTFADSPITISASDRGKFFSIDCSGGAITVNLPAIAGLDLSSAYAIGIKKEDSSGNSITINRASTDTIDGSTSKVIGVAGSGTTLIPDTDPAPDMWTAADFGASAGNMTVDTFSGTGAQTAFTLSVSPGSKNNMQVLVGNVPQYKSTYSLSGTTLTFSVAPALGTNNIEVTSGTTLSIGTPSDGTVTTVKIVDAAVTGAKLNDSVVNDLTTVTIASGDLVAIADVSDSNKKKKALVSDIVSLAQATNTIHVRDEKASGTSGGAASATTTATRTLNQTVTNTITGASLAGNQVTLPAGTYEVYGRAPGYSVNEHKASLYNITDAGVQSSIGGRSLVGSSAIAIAASSNFSDSIVEGEFTIASAKVFELRHYTASANANGFGAAVTSGLVEVYAELRFIKKA